VSGRLRFFLLAENGDGEIARLPIEPDADTCARLARAVAGRERVRLRALERTARSFLGQHPEAKANDFYRLVRGRKSDALTAFKRAKQRRDG
jgi:hypothetical protein